MAPPRVPTRQLEARGSWRADTRPKEPQPDRVTTIEPPAHLPARAANVWRSLAAGLVTLGVLTSADVHAFARYCRLLVVLEDAVTAIEATPDRTEVLKVAKLSDIVTKLESKFGLTPVDRAGLSVDVATDSSKSRFFEAR